MQSLVLDEALSRWNEFYEYYSGLEHWTNPTLFFSHHRWLESTQSTQSMNTILD